jgi:pimeloyl-ACP methyl ester carboxylesterase
MINLLLPTGRYGLRESLVRLYFDGNVVRIINDNRPSSELSSGDSSRKLFTIDFYSAGFETNDVANVSIEAKAFELKAVIDEAKRISGQSQVILVGHSMGGLVARAYVQNRGSAVPFQNDVASIITIDTPHQGSDQTNWLGLPTSLLPAASVLRCLTSPSVNLTQLTPRSVFLETLNAQPLSDGVRIVSIATWMAVSGRPAGDLIVSYDSQNLRDIALYKFAANIFERENAFSSLFGFEGFHTRVHDQPQTANLVHQDIRAADDWAAQDAPGRPTLVASVTGNTVTLSWTAGPGGAPSSYSVAVGRSAGASDVFAQDLGLLTLVSGALPSGRYFFRVTAINSSGSATSDEIAITVGLSIEAPGTPSNFRAGVSGFSVSLSWNAPSTGGMPTTYVIEAGSSTGASNLANFGTGNTATTFFAPAVGVGTYFARVRARNSAGTSGPSNEWSFTVGQSPVSFEIAGGPYVDFRGLVATAVVFNPYTSAGLVSRVDIAGPPSWNGGQPLVLFPNQPAGIATQRAFAWHFAPAVSGTYTAVALANGVTYSRTFSINSAAQLPVPLITRVELISGGVSFDWIAPTGTRSFLVRVNPLPFTGSVTREMVVPAATRTATFTSLPLVAGAQYQAVVFALSQDVITPDAIAGAFNMSGQAATFTAAQGPTPTIPTDNYADLGNQTDEANHNLRGWGTVNPGLLPLGIDSDQTSRYQRLRALNELDLFVPQAGVPYFLTMRTEDGACDDSFEVFVNDRGPLYRYRHRTSSEVFPVHRFQVDRSVISSRLVKVTIRNLAGDSCGNGAVYFVRLDPP